MKIYNPTDSQLELPFNGEYLRVPAFGTSDNFFCTPEFISLIITSFTPKEICFIVGGASEISLIANVLGAGEYACQSLDEAVQKFQVDKKEE